MKVENATRYEKRKGKQSNEDYINHIDKRFNDNAVKKDNITIPTRNGKWYEVDTVMHNGKKYFIMEHETLGDLADWVVIDADNNEIDEDLQSELLY